MNYAQTAMLFNGWKKQLNIIFCVPSIGPPHIRSMPLDTIWMLEAFGNFWRGT